MTGPVEKETLLCVGGDNHGTPEGCDNMLGKDPLVVLLEVQFTSLCVHAIILRASLKVGFSVQIWVKGTDVKIPYDLTFNIYTKNSFICLC